MLAERFHTISLLRPEDIKDEIDQWVENAIPEETADKFTAYKTISSLISDLRINVREFNLPYLAFAGEDPEGSGIGCVYQDEHKLGEALDV